MGPTTRIRRTRRLVLGTVAAPVVTTQPANQTYHSGGSVSFTAAASGTPAPTLQWQYSANRGASWSTLSGATSSPLSVGPLNNFVNGWEVRAVFANSTGTATSNAATMTRPLLRLRAFSSLRMGRRCRARPPWYGWVCSWGTTAVPNGSHTLVSEACGWDHIQRGR